MIIGEAHALGRHVIEVGRCVALGAVDREIAEAHVVHEDDHEVGFAVSGNGGESWGEEERRIQKKHRPVDGGRGRL